MALSAGTRLGPYEILAPLGAGGMGEVYRARDTRIDRTVAIKVLPPGLAASPEARQRFEREARAVSSLNHPHICTLYDVGQQDDIHFLVMEHLEGETLSARIEKGPLPIGEALPFAIQIADALDRAHRQGLVHRDLKPGNIMLTKAGAKLLDFGLAKSIEGVPGSHDMTAAATATSPLTAQGAVVGTFQYMAPEQLEGGQADARSDIFAFGAVVYEMITGCRAFEGKTHASLAAAILKETPRPLSALQPVTPPALERLVTTCLEKDRDERRQTMHDVLLELRWIAEGGGDRDVPAGGGPARGGSGRLAWVLAAVASAVAAVAILLPVLRTPVVSTPGYHVALRAPEDVEVGLRDGPMALSPDGRMVVFVARHGDDEPQLWLRALDRDSAGPMEGTEGASYPFWSPDSRSIGFFAGGRLKRIEAAGGVADTLCDVRAGNGGTWNRDGVILFSGAWDRGLMRVNSSGGQPETVTRLNESAGEFVHRHPSFLPDGRHFLFSVWHGIGGENNVMLGSLEGGEPRLLLGINSNAVYADPGFLLYWRDDALRAHPFDPSRLEFTGEPFPLAPGTRFEPDSGVALFSVSATGVLAFHRGGSATTKSRLVLRDRQGGETRTVGDPGNYYSPRFSRDGRKVAVDNSGVQNNGDIWVYDLTRPVATRLTSNPADESDPVWSPDGALIVFFSSKRGQSDLYLLRSSGTAPEEDLLVSEAGNRPYDWSMDGRHLLYGQEATDGSRRSDLWVLDMESKEARPFLATQFHEAFAQFSPDGRWIAYESNESGRREVYLRSFPSGEEKWQISTDGGGVPRWRADGGELFYMTEDAVLMVVTVAPEGETLRAGTPRTLFRTNMRFAASDHYDVAPDGEIFVINEFLAEETTEPMSLMINWNAAAARP